MKKVSFILGAVMAVMGGTSVLAAEEKLPAYGDLYNVQWCPCNPEEPFDANGAVVMGKTVMCPCDGLYSGFKKGLEEDLRDIKVATKNQLRKLNYFKYYVGMDYNMASPSASSKQLVFDDIRFAQGPIKINPDALIDDQDSLSFVLGARMSKWFGLEAFYEKSYKDNTTSQIDNNTLNASGRAYYLMNDYTTSYSAYGLDLIGYIPLSAYFDLLGSVGMANYKFENKANFAVYQFDGSNLDTVINRNFDDDNWGYRIAFGAQINIAEGVALRGMYRYISIDGNVVEDMSEFSLGVRFLF